MKKAIEEIYNQLSWKEKEALNILSIEYISRFKSTDRPHPVYLIRKVTKKNLTINYSNNLIEIIQFGKLRRELRKYKSKIKKSSSHETKNKIE